MVRWRARLSRIGSSPRQSLGGGGSPWIGGGSPGCHGLPGAMRVVLVASWHGDASCVAPTRTEMIDLYPGGGCAPWAMAASAGRTVVRPSATASVLFMMHLLGR
jgi:hypothetical protein